MSVRKIKLANGATLSLDYTEQFDKIVRKHFNIDREPTDAELSSYVLFATKNALDKLN